LEKKNSLENLVYSTREKIESTKFEENTEKPN